MNMSTPYVAERWLICSPAAFDSISEYWLSEAGPASLLAWRLAKGLIEWVPTDDLKKRFRSLATAGGSISIVFDEIDSQAAELAMHLNDDDLDSYRIKIVDWRQSPLATVITMNSPDRDLLAWLKAPEEARVAPKLADPGLLFALAHWERGCRAGQPEAFALAYPAFAVRPIHWELVPANDREPIEFRVKALAAASKSERSKVIQFDAPLGTLTWAPVIGEKAGYLMFSCYPDSIVALQGCRVRVDADGARLDLGVIQEDGVADIRLEQFFDIREARVIIGDEKS